jgi:hypothetical protein
MVATRGDDPEREDARRGARVTPLERLEEDLGDDDMFGDFETLVL